MCWFSMARLFMFVFNFALFVAGGATLGVGIWIFTSNTTTDLVGVSISQNGSIVLMAAGSAAVLIGFLGCCGAKNESTGLLGLYFFILLLVVIAEIAVGIWAAVNFDSVDEAISDGLRSLDLTKQGNIDTMNSLSQEFQCCGNNASVPICDLQNDYSGLKCNCTGDNCITCEGSTNSIYGKSCDTAVADFVDENMRVIAGIGIAIGIVEILGLLFSWCMCQSIKEHKGYA